jgi:signal transduction histidine kinase
MAKILRVLFIEDEEDDVALLLHELARGGYDVTYERVDTEHALRIALTRSEWDVILSDFSMPTFDGPQALAIVKELRIDVPFIIVSGTADEVIAVVSMRAGAHDFVTKLNLARLLPAIARELEDAAVRAERSHMREQLLLSDRMVSLGTLAAGVGHEINNPLAALLANLDSVVGELRAAWTDYDLAQDTLASEDVIGAAGRLAASVASSLPALDEVHQAAARIRELSADLKAFAWRDREEPTPLDVRRILESSLRLANTEIRHRARVVRAYEDVPPVAATETRLGQVFLNLLINAAHAIPDGDAGRHEIRVTTRSSGDRVVVEIHDTGSGIPDEIIARIFDPFFTTKPRGVGSGLGLAISHRVVTELGGEISVESRRGRGTTFRVSLPAAGDATIAARPPSPTTHAKRETRRRIMIVDDDVLVLSAARRVLSVHHDVWTTTQAGDALERLLGGAECDLLLCDLLMPNLSGMALHRELEVRSPEHATRMVFMTGGAFTDEAQRFLATTKQPCIDKPFTADDLRRAMDELLV